MQYPTATVTVTLINLTTTIYKTIRQVLFLAVLDSFLSSLWPVAVLTGYRFRLDINILSAVMESSLLMFVAKVVRSNPLVRAVCVSVQNMELDPYVHVV